MGSCGSWRKLAEKAVAGIKGALLDWDDILAFHLRGRSFSSYTKATRPSGAAAWLSGFIWTTFNG